ncbi:helix-turn-helix domain-containing protein [Brevibacillus invocatus]|uniref:helix-turn-helix domain-containing protein n=1 Tax=Brevibacillus invocatus TaxID=173959 RepID=UPI0020402E0F|nr:helix-turn-helix domain-containing protein [Brevibacillus invocatus]EAO9488507.1 DNA-binding protein [Salmonella enterica]MCM3080495.1 helix-turn-helix domain-containing protein [Brevibacillus invocatus]MCM3430742.1 helix-turn-helix domain-containing protein [Brevibacillus invocatus]
MKLYSLPEVAEILNLSPVTVSSWFGKHKLHNPLEVISGIKLEKINGQWKVPDAVVSSYSEFMKDHKTMTESAILAGVHVCTIREWIHKKRLKSAVKIGNTVYINTAELPKLKTAVSNEEISESNCNEKMYSIREAADVIKVDNRTVSAWFRENLHNPLELVSGTRLQKYKGQWRVPEHVLSAYLDFTNHYITTKDSAAFLGVSDSTIRDWVSQKIFKTAIKIGKIIYIDRKEIAPYTNCVGRKQVAEFLKVAHHTAGRYLVNGLIEGAFKVGAIWFVPRSCLERFAEQIQNSKPMSKKKEFVSIPSTFPNGEDYISIGEAAKFLGFSTASLRAMLEHDKIDLNGVKVGLNNRYFVKREDIIAYRIFYESIKDEYVTASQLAKEFRCSDNMIYSILPKLKGVRWACWNRKYQQVIPRGSVNEFLDTPDGYFFKKPIEPHDVFQATIGSSPIPDFLSNTAELFFTYFRQKASNSKASLVIRQKNARDHGKLFNHLVSLLHKDIHLYNDEEVKQIYLQFTSSSQKTAFTFFLKFVQSHRESKFSEDYRISTVSFSRNESKSIYTRKEFIQCQQYLSNVETHLSFALKNRLYAVTWLYASLHLINAWRSSDFMQLPAVNTTIINVHSLTWFELGNRLEMSQAQRIINQYESKRMKVSKTGALNKFLVNLDMVIPIATMIVICDLHRQMEKDTILMRVQSKSNRIRENNLQKVFHAYPFLFSSRKMNRSFMSYVFYQAEKNTKSMRVALELTRYTRRHKEADTTSIYIESTNNDEPIESVTIELCNRGHFGYLYNIMIESLFHKQNSTIEERTSDILEVRKIFKTPLMLEDFGSFLQAQQMERKSLAHRIALLPKEELKKKIVDIYQDKMPSRTEHNQCLTYPTCEFPERNTCIGCVNGIPKHYLLISLKIELEARLKIINSTNKPSVAEREKVWIMRYLSVLQEAVDAHGKELIESFIHFEDLFNQVLGAFDKLALMKDIALSEVKRIEPECRLQEKASNED